MTSLKGPKATLTEVPFQAKKNKLLTSDAARSKKKPGDKISNTGAKKLNVVEK